VASFSAKGNDQLPAPPMLDDGTVLQTYPLMAVPRQRPHHGRIFDITPDLWFF